MGKIEGIGLMLGIEIVVDKESKTIPIPGASELVQSRGVEKGAYFRIMQNKVCFNPACTITEHEAKRGLDIIFSVLAELKRKDLTA